MSAPTFGCRLPSSWPNVIATADPASTRTATIAPSATRVRFIPLPPRSPVARFPVSQQVPGFPAVCQGADADLRRTNLEGADLSDANLKNAGFARAGRTFGISAIHVWRLERERGRTRVKTEESMEGLPTRLLRGTTQKELDNSVDGWLRNLKAESERRS
jgi:hypothetical protein